MTNQTMQTLDESARRKAIGVVFLVIVIDLLGFGALLPLLPLYGDRLKAGALTIGFLSSSFSLAQFLFTPWWGQLSDRIGRRPVLLAGLLLASAFYILFGYAAWAENLALMFVARIGAGAACATISAAQAVIADCTSHEKRTSGMALVGAAFGIGFTFGPLLGWQALSLDPASSRFEPLSPMPGLLAAALSALAFTIGVFFLPETRKTDGPTARGNRFDQNAWRKVSQSAVIAWTVFAYFAATVGFTQFEGTISLLLKRVFELLDRQIYQTYFYIGITFALAQGVLVRRLARRISDVPLAISGATLIGIGVLVGSLCLGLKLFWVMLLAVPFMACGYAMTTTSLQSLISKRTPGSDQGAVLGVNQSAAALARIIGLTLGPTLLFVNHHLPYLVTLLLQILVVMLLWRQVRVVQLGEIP